MILLTLVLPRVFEEELVDHLLEHPEWVPGFTSHAVDGHGATVVYRGSAEEVRGRSVRVRVDIVTEQDHAEALLAHLASHLHSEEIAWWITPVAAFGRFA